MDASLLQPLFLDGDRGLYELMMSARRVRDTYSVFVGQLEPEVTKDDLRMLFRECGVIADIVIMEDKNKGRKNFGFVRFYDSESAFKASSELNRWTLKGSQILVDISKDTAEKVKLEKGISCKKRALKSTRDSYSRPNDSVKDAMYFNRLRDTLTSLNLQYAAANDQINYNRLLKDIGPISTFCPTMFASMKEFISFEKVSAKIMEKCKEKEEEVMFGEKRSEEFKKSLQIIMSEVSKVIGSEKPVNLDTDEENEGNDKTIFDQHVIPESVRIIQKLEKYTEPVKVENVQNSRLTEKKLDERDNESKHCKMSDAEVMTDITELDYCVNSINNLTVDDDHNQKEENEKDFYDPAILDFHQSKVEEMALSEIKSDIENKDVAHLGNQNAFGNENYVDDPLEALYLKMNARNQNKLGLIPRSGSRDSSMSEESVDGNIDDSGVECDGATFRGTPTHAIVDTRHEIYRAEGRPRPVDHGHSGNHWRKTEEEKDANREQPCREFSLEKYISKNVGRGRGLFNVNSEPQLKSLGRGRGLFSDLSTGK